MLLLAAAAVSAALVFYVWRRRDTRGAGAVVLMMLAVFVWSFGYAFEIGAADLGAKVFWAKVEYLGIVTVPFAWLIFALRYTGQDHALTRRNLALLVVVPLATLLLVATNETLCLIWSRTALSPSGWFLTLEHGTGFWVYSYVLLVLGTFYLISRLVRSPLRDREGRSTGRLLVLREVTERKRTEEELIRQKAELARSNAELENFAYLIAHDLRAPLRGVNGFSHILLEDHAGGWTRRGAISCAGSGTGPCG